MIMRRSAVLGSSWVVLCCLAIPAAAQQPTISFITISGGAGSATGGGVTLNQTIGEPIAGVVATGANTVSFGFWEISDRLGAVPAIPTFTEWTMIILAVVMAGYVLLSNRGEGIRGIRSA